MTKDQEKTDRYIDNFKSQINVLIDEANKIDQEIGETNEAAAKEMGAIIVKVDESISDIEQICADLDQAEKNAGDDIDKLILEQAEDLASE